MQTIYLTIFWAIFFITFPILIMYLCQKYSILDSIGAVVLCYGAGIIVGNTGLLPENIFATQDIFLSVTIPIALPLLFFSIDIKQWLRLAGKSTISFFSAIISVLISASVALYLFKDSAIEAWKLSGMLIGCYTGGTPNLASIGTALEVDAPSYVALHAADTFMGAIFLLMAITIFPKIFRKILPPFKFLNSNTGSEADTDTGFETNFTGFTKDKTLPLAIALGLAILIFGVGGGLTLVVPKSVAMVTAILTITTLGVASSFIKKIRETDYTFQLGYFFILIFSLVVSSMADVSKLLDTAPVMIAYVAVAVFLAATIHALLSYIFKVDADTHIVTSIALVMSPPFVPMVAAALKNKEVVASGVITGIAGWVVGNYLGISVAYFLKNFFY